MVSQFPLSKFTPSHRQTLTKILWSWEICSLCLDGKHCEPPSCPWHRSSSLKPFFQFYEEETSAYRSDVKAGQQHGLSSHEDLFNIIKKLKEEPNVTRGELVEKLFPDRPVRGDQERAVDLAVRVMFMVNCSSPRQDSVLVEAGVYQSPWRNDVSLSKFIEGLFVERPHPNIEHIEENLRAVKLKKIARLNFEPTDDVRQHLNFDHKKAVVRIFHHAAFLKEQLRLTKDERVDISTYEAIKLGALPRTLVLETLNSIQTLLFPLTDSKSKSLLKSLTTTHALDSGILRYEFNTVCNPDEKEAVYQYFTTELGDLYEEQSNPMLRGAQKWWEKKSGARYVMMVTVAGIIFAFLSLGLGGFQAWIGWQQWRHPVSSGDK